MVINIKYIILFIFFSIPLILVMIKHFFESSIVFGTLLFSFCFFLIYIIKPIVINFSKKYLIISISIMFVIFIVSIVSYINNTDFNYNRFIISFISSIYLLFIAFFLSKYLNKIESLSFYKTINIIFYIFLFDGLFSTIKFIGFNGSKETIFFNEPSHFALNILPLFLFKLITNQKVKSINFIIIILMFIIALFLENLTLLIGTCLAVVIISRLKYFIIYIFILIVIFLQLNIDYFTSRLNFFDDITNLSLLVFLSGWERAILNLIETYGLGLGFNQLGYIGPDGYYMSIIYDLVGIRLNFNDGGTTGSKIISELGVLGLFGLIIYIYTTIKFIVFLRRKFIILDYKDIFLFSVFIMYIVELFIRGIGYFSITTFLFIVSVFYTNNYSFKK